VQAVTAGAADTAGPANTADTAGARGAVVESVSGGVPTTNAAVTTVAAEAAATAVPTGMAVNIEGT
ncbi:hypothetical protein OSI51_25410, partial [Mycobacterium ulcerans]